MTFTRLGATWIGATVLLLIVFVSGALLGAAGMRIMDWPDDADRTVDAQPRNPGDRMNPGMRPPGGRFLRALEERLDLTEQQREEVDDILDRRQRHAREIFESIGPRVRASIDSMEAEIRAVLTDEQVAAYADFLAESRGREGWDGRRGRPPEGPRFPGDPNRRRRPPSE
jgi:hypothetical protein